MLHGTTLRVMQVMWVSISKASTHRGILPDEEGGVECLPVKRCKLMGGLDKICGYAQPLVYLIRCQVLF